MDLLVNPPSPDNASESTWRKYREEVKAISDDLKIKAKMIHSKLNLIKNFKCNEIEGAMYAFPSIVFPHNFIEEAKSHKKQPDYYYCEKLLENTGLITVPGSGFGQKEGTYHLRLTNLICPKEELMRMLDKIEVFNEKFFAKY
jgi:alanine transaminase